MSNEKLITEPKQEPQFPMMQLQVTELGILVTIVYSGVEKRDLLIPAQNADAISAAWLAARPPEVMRDVVQMRKNKSLEQQTIAAVRKNPLKVVQ